MSESTMFAGRARQNTNTDPTKVIDEKTGRLKIADHKFPTDLGPHQFHMLFHSFGFY